MTELRDAAQMAEQREQTCQHDVEQLASQRGAALVELARQTLPDLERDTIQSTLGGIQRDLSLIAERKERTVIEMQGRITRLVDVEQQLQQQHQSTQVEIARHAASVAGREVEVSRQLQSHPSFPQQSRDAVAAEAALHRDEQRVADVQADASEKRPAYEHSALFMYLYRRGFQTSHYAERGWTRRMDHWVADLIGYSRAVRGYQFLKNTPSLMQTELDRRRTRFHELMAAVEAIQNQIATEVGLTQLQFEMAGLQAASQQLATNLTTQRQLVAGAQSELAVLGQEQCRFYQEALVRYQSFLADTQTAILEQQAARTPDARDDEIVSRIAYLTGEIERLRPELEQATQRTVQALEAVRGLEFIERRFEQANFDEERSRFDDRFDLGQRLSQYQQGVLSRDALWAELKDHQQFERTDPENAVYNVLQHPVTHVLAEAMVQVVGAALRQGVDRSLRRREIGESRAGGITLPDLSPPQWIRTDSNSSSTPEGGRYRTGRTF